MSEKELPPSIQGLIDQICKENGFSDYSMEINPGLEVGDGYTSDILSVRICENGKEKSLNIMCKISPDNKDKALFAKDAFGREIAFYEKVVLSFTKFQTEKNLSKEDQFLAFPKFYAVLTDDENLKYAIAMEDLRPQNFKLWSKAKPTSIENAKIAMRELGKFHGLSIAMKDQRSEEFSKLQQMRDLSRPLF